MLNVDEQFIMTVGSAAKHRTSAQVGMQFKFLFPCFPFTI